MKISFINGICVHHDAISNAIRDEVNWLSKIGCHDVVLFTYSCTHPELPYIPVVDLPDVILHPHFQASDIVIFHYGIYSPLFNLIFVAPSCARKVVVFHNITPKEFLPASDHELIEQSYAQMCNISKANQVLCVSDTNAQVLIKAGIRTPQSVIPLALHSAATPPTTKPSFDAGLVRVAYVGRLVQSKGPLDLLEVVDRALAGDPALRLRLDMVGNLEFSHPHQVRAVSTALQRLKGCYGHRLAAELHGNADDELKFQLLSQADLFVLPSRHEGFCVPILEAMASGCKVISYSNSNIPAAAGGLARLVKTGDLNALTSAFTEALDEVMSEAWGQGGGYAAYLRSSADHLRAFDPDVVSRRYLNFIEKYH